MFTESERLETYPRSTVYIYTLRSYYQISRTMHGLVGQILYIVHIPNSMRAIINAHASDNGPEYIIVFYVYCRISAV